METAIYHSYEWCILLLLVINFLWQYEKRRRIKFLDKITRTDPTITNKNAKEKINDYKFKVERSNWHRRMYGNHIGVITSLVWAFLMFVLTYVIGIAPTAYPPIFVWIGLMGFYVVLHARWLLSFF